jgi:hypothetical protein
MGNVDELLGSAPWQKLANNPIPIKKDSKFDSNPGLK